MVGAEDDVLRIIELTSSAPSYDGSTSTPASNAQLAVTICRALASNRNLRGFDLDDGEVDGGDAVELLGEVWPFIRQVVPKTGKSRKQGTHQ